MPKSNPDPQLSLEIGAETGGAEAAPHPESLRPTALVHILTPEFQGIEAEDFQDISESMVESAAPEILKKYLFDIGLEGTNVVRYRSVEQNDKWLSIAVNPEHFNLFARHIHMLAATAINKAKESKDTALREATGDPSARARSDQDLRESERAAVRAVMGKEQAMKEYVAEELMPRIELIEKFLEMTQGKNYNLARGSREAVHERFEQLRTFVFGDMLDAIGGQRKWSQELAQLAERIIQKRLYIKGTSREKVKNFNGMLGLAQEYYGNIRALVLGRVAEIHKYYREHPSAVADVIETDRQRREEKQAKQLQLQPDQE